MTTDLDPITIQVIRGAIKAVAEEMMVSLIKTAHNPLIYEVQDFGVGLSSHHGHLLADGSGLPGFIGCLPRTVQSGLQVIGADGFAEGDIVLSNEPYDTGTHISDTVVYMPIFHDGRLEAFSAIMAHWADIGGRTPCGWCPDSTDVHQEGLIFPHLKLHDAGELNRELHRLILANVRFPSVVEGDLNAMIAACRTGALRYGALCERYGADALRDAMAQVFDQSERRMRREITAIPDGEYKAETHMDHDGVEIDKPFTMRVSVTVDGDELRIDWEGTDPVTKGPVNHPGPGTEALGEVAIKSLLMPMEPMNHGHLRPISVTMPDDTVVNPSYPAPSDSYGYVGEMVIHLVVRALSAAIPELCPACTYQLCAASFYRMDPRAGDPFILGEPVDGGGGALPHDDGPSGTIFVGDGDAPNTPVEVIEGRFPILMRRYTFNPAGAGPGKYRGGFGVIRDYEMLEDDILVQTANENSVCPPWGLFGGESAGASKIVLWVGSSREKVTSGRFADLGPFNRGDRVSVRTGGGGGWGNPKERDPDRVRDDVLNEFITAEEAASIYGITINAEDHHA